jgi:hypothetical protein
MPALTLARSVAILREHRNQTSERYADLCISLRVCDFDTSGPDPIALTETEEEILRVGGRWDRRDKKWSGDAKSGFVIRIPRGSDQEQPARWLAEWFRRNARGRDGAHWDIPTEIPGKRVSVTFRRVWTLMLVGGRRGGKSHLAVVSLVLMAVMVPRSIVWAISPTQEETDELEVAVRSLLPRRWYTTRQAGAGKSLQFKLANGSRLLFLSGHKPRSLKRGRCDLAVLNEAQNMYEATWRQLRGAIADKAGLCILPCNPPDAEIGRWIERVYEEIRGQKIEAEAFHLTARDNPFVSMKALESMRREVDDITAAKEIDGKMGVPIGDVVLHSWSPESIRDVPANFVDITAEVTKRHLGRAAGYVIGMDFQMQPHEAAAAIKFFKDPDDPTEVIPWVVDCFQVEDADENQLLDAIEHTERWTPAGRVDGECYRGWTEDGDDPEAPVLAVVVMDASAWWQDSAHHQGKRSDRILASRRWTFCYRPQKDSDRNPQISERVKTTNARLKTADLPDGTPGRRRMFSCTHCVEVNRALAQWENNKITKQPNRRSPFAHMADAVSYVVYRFFGVPKVKGSGKEYRSVGKRTRADELKRF